MKGHREGEKRRGGGVGWGWGRNNGMEGNPIA